MNLEKLEKHIKKLCKPNLRSNRVKCCGDCPFEEEICNHDPSLKSLFQAKRELNKCRPHQ
jgi:hypothetical protein